MSFNQRRFKFRMIGSGFLLMFITFIFLWFLVTNPGVFGEDLSIKLGTVSGLIFIGALIFTAYAIKVKLRQHNLTKR